MQSAGNIDWYNIFHVWQESTNPIIELHCTLAQIYPTNHTVSDRELRAWHAMLEAAGCTNITPFNDNESKVRSHI